MVEEPITKQINSTVQETDVSCRLLACDFERTLCDYEAYRLDDDLAALEFICSPVPPHLRLPPARSGTLFI